LHGAHFGDLFFYSPKMVRIKIDEKSYKYKITLKNFQ